MKVNVASIHYDVVCVYNVILFEPNSGIVIPTHVGFDVQTWLRCSKFQALTKSVASNEEDAKCEENVIGHERETGDLRQKNTHRCVHQSKV